MWLLFLFSLDKNLNIKLIIVSLNNSYIVTCITRPRKISYKMQQAVEQHLLEPPLLFCRWSEIRTQYNGIKHRRHHSKLSNSTIFELNFQINVGTCHAIIAILGKISNYWNRTLCYEADNQFLHVTLGGNFFIKILGW